MRKQYPVMLCILLLGAASCQKNSSKGAAQAPVSLDKHTSPKPCPGTAAKVRENCGCNPIDSSLINVVETLQINQTIKTRVQSCAQGKFGLDVASTTRAKGEFQSCVTQNTEIPPEAMTQLMSAVDRATQETDSHKQELSSWLVCYEIQTGVYAEKKANPNEARSCTPDDLETCWRGCDKKENQSCATLGSIYLTGDRVTKDPKRAEIFYQRACDNRDAESCHTLAMLFFEGKEVKEDEARASSLFAKACQLGKQESCTPPKKVNPLDGRH